MDALVAGIGGGLRPVSVTVAFLGGMLAGFGPCVLPMLPVVFGYVTGSVVGRQGTTPASGLGHLRGLALSAAFVLGMASVFTVLGVAAGLLGRAITPAAWTYYLVAVVCVVIGLHMLGVVTVPFDRLNRRAPRVHDRRRGLFGAAALGALFGAVASPCATPILAAIATLAAAGRDPFAGGILLFAFGIGKGVPLMLLGAASGSLPLMRVLSGATRRLTAVAGAALIAAAVYLVWIA